MLREHRGKPREGWLYPTLIGKPNWRRKDTMETISIHDVGLVVGFIALALAPRAIATYFAIRK